MVDRDSTVIFRETYRENVSKVCGPGDYVPREAMREFTNQYELDRREMQYLNEKLNEYIRRNQSLDEEYRALRAQLDEWRGKWGFDSTPLKQRYDPQLEALRKEIDEVSARKANAELDSKRSECDTLSMKKQIDFINQLIALENNRASKLRQLLENIRVEIEALENRFRDRDDELTRSKDEIGLLQESFLVKKDEYDREARARVTAQNELQTLEEQIAFFKAIHEEERNALNSVIGLTLIDDQFYDTQLSITISLIRRDFEKLSQERRQQLEAYYKFKTESFMRVVQEKERISREDRDSRVPIDTTALRRAMDEEKQSQGQLQRENADIARQSQQLEGQLEQAYRESRRREEKQKQELGELCVEIQKREREVAVIVDNNVSVQFEINTYRRLLELDYTPRPVRVPTPPPPQVEESSTEVQTMTVQKTAQGAIVIDQIDPSGEFIVIRNTGATNETQNLAGWTLRRKIGGLDEMSYQFPEGLQLKPNSRLRILGRDSKSDSRGQRDTIVADSIPTWGMGTSIETRLFDARREQRAAWRQSMLRNE